MNIRSTRVAVIYFESNIPRWLEQLLKINIFRGLNVTFDAGEFKNLEQDQEKRNRELILITNYRCVKGLEFSHVLFLL